MIKTRLALAVIAIAAVACAFPNGLAYDPLEVALNGSSVVETLDLDVIDASRERSIPIRVYSVSNQVEPQPVILFSHGLGGSRQANPYLGNHWAARGYIVVFLQHPGSDQSVWEDLPLRERRKALEKAASPKSFRQRVTDVPTVLDQLEIWNATEGHPLQSKLDLDRVGMSGHSFGAVTTQAVSGQTYARGLFSFTDKRIDAAVIMSPSSPRRGGGPQKAFGKVQIPWLLMTGTEDHAPIGNASVQDRLEVYPALPPGGKYELVLHEGQHYAFSETRVEGLARNRNPNHHRVILALSTAFWDAYLMEDQEAQAWLDRDGPYSVLEPEDRWLRK